MRKKVDKGLFYTGGRDNIGDSMVPWLIKAISGKELIYSNPREVRGEHLFTIGSILQYADSGSTIWGSGFISSSAKFHDKPKNILALRGPLTNQRVQELTGVKCDIFGDPALLVSDYIENSHIKTKYKIGLIPHYADKNKISKTRLVHDDSIKICNVETSSIYDFVNDISECEVIVSSSLHGIIIAESLGIPAVWAKFDSDVTGDGFKFFDYYFSTKRNIRPLNFYEINRKDVFNAINCADFEIKKIKHELLLRFPHEYL